MFRNGGTVERSEASHARAWVRVREYGHARMHVREIIHRSTVPPFLMGVLVFHLSGLALERSVERWNGRVPGRSGAILNGGDIR